MLVLLQQPDVPTLSPPVVNLSSVFDLVYDCPTIILDTFGFGSFHLFLCPLDDWIEHTMIHTIQELLGFRVVIDPIHFLKREGPFLHFLVIPFEFFTIVDKSSCLASLLLFLPYHVTLIIASVALLGISPPLVQILGQLLNFRHDFLAIVTIDSNLPLANQIMCFCNF